jgi:hypothetical protein
MLSSAASFEIEDLHWWLPPGSDPEPARSCVETALHALANGAQNLKRGRRKQLYRIDLGDGLGEALLKVNRYDRGAGAPRRLRRSKARRELAVAVGLSRREIEAPLPIAAGELRAGLRLEACYLLVRARPDAVDLERHWRSDGGTRRERAALLSALGREVRRWHDAGLLQHDLAPNNILVDATAPARLLPIDFERARLRRRLGVRARSRMLANFDAHFPGASASERMRFLIAYAQGDRRLARRWWRRLVRAAATQAAREHARLRRHSGVPGRRTERIQWGVWSGWARRGDALLASARADCRDVTKTPAPDTIGRHFEPRGPLWCATGRSSERAAQRLWANAELLARRGLGPRPVAIARDDRDRLRLWLARSPAAQPLLARRDSARSRAAAVVLFERLLAVGRIEPWLGPRKILLARRPDGSPSAELLDPGAFRCGRVCTWKLRARARRRLATRLREVEQLLEIANQSRPPEI